MVRSIILTAILLFWLPSLALASCPDWRPSAAIQRDLLSVGIRYTKPIPGSVTQREPGRCLRDVTANNPIKNGYPRGRGAVPIMLFFDSANERRRLVAPDYEKVAEVAIYVAQGTSLEKERAWLTSYAREFVNLYSSNRLATLVPNYRERPDVVQQSLSVSGYTDVTIVQVRYPIGDGGLRSRQGTFDARANYLSFALGIGRIPASSTHGRLGATHWIVVVQNPSGTINDHELPGRLVRAVMESLRPG